MAARGSTRNPDGRERSSAVPACRRRPALAAFSRTADQATSRRRPNSAVSRAVRSRLRSAHRPEERSSLSVLTARCSACVAGEREPLTPAGVIGVVREHHHAAGHTLRLPQSGDRVRPVMDGADRHRGAEGLVLERQTLRSGGHARRRTRGRCARRAADGPHLQMLLRRRPVPHRPCLQFPAGLVRGRSAAGPAAAEVAARAPAAGPGPVGTAGQRATLSGAATRSSRRARPSQSPGTVTANAPAAIAVRRRAAGPAPAIRSAR